MEEMHAAMQKFASPMIFLAGQRSIPLTKSLPLNLADQLTFYLYSSTFKFPQLIIIYLYADKLETFHFI